MRNTADVVVIGAGIVGAAVAHCAAAEGLRVAVLESGRPGQQGSGTTAGNVHIQTIHPRRPGQLVPVDVRRLLPLQRAARALWEHWEEQIGPVGFRRSGGFMVAETDEQVADLHRKHQWEVENGIPTEVLDGEAARSVLPLFGPTVAAATWCESDGFADPALVTPALVRRSEELGADVRSHRPVTGLERTVNGWRVLAGADTWTAPTVVNAAGPWIAEVAAMAGVTIRMTPTAIQMLTLAARGRTLPMVIAHVGEGFSVKQTDDGAIMVGGGWPAGAFSGHRPATIEPSSVTGNLAQVNRILPVIGAGELDRVWSGPLAATPDEMPVIGEIPGAPGLFVVGGTYSFTFAPLWGALMTSIVQGREPMVDVTDLGPGRFTTQRRGAR